MQREMGIKARGAIYIYFSFTQDGEVKSRCSSNQCSWYQTFQRPPQAPDPWTLTNLGFDLNNISSIWLGDEHFVFINYSWLALVILGGKTAIIGLPHRGPRTLPSSIPFTLPVTPLITSLKCVLSKKLFHSNATFFPFLVNQVSGSLKKILWWAHSENTWCWTAERMEKVCCLFCFVF